MLKVFLLVLWLLLYKSKSIVKQHEHQLYVMMTLWFQIYCSMLMYHTRCQSLFKFDGASHATASNSHTLNAYKNWAKRIKESQLREKNRSQFKFYQLKCSLITIYIP